MINETVLYWIDNKCDWCNSNETETIVECQDFLQDLPGLFRVVRCKNCGIYRQNPQLDWSSLQHYYPNEYIAHSSLVSEEVSKYKRVVKRYGNWKKYRLINHYKSNGGNLLDIGCGTGLFLEEVLRSKKWNVYGVEPSVSAASYAKTKLGVTVYNDKFSNVMLPRDYFDVITMWNVLEHLDHPIDALKRIELLLKPKGLLIISIPNPNSLARHVFGKYWVGWDQPRHLYIFPLDKLRLILAHLNFTILAEKCISTSYATLGLSLNFWSKNWNSKISFWRTLLNVIYNSTMSKLLLLLPLKVLDMLRLSSIITIVAQKSNQD